MTKSKSLVRPIERKWYGWNPDVPDQRDFKFATPPRRKLSTLPPRVDLRSGCSPVEDQGALGSCTANALVGCLEFLEKKRDPTPTNLSRLFIYFNEREIEGSINEDSGAYIRDGIKSLAAIGVCPESKWPYKIDRFKRRPSAACYSAAAAHKIARYERLSSIDDMRACLADGFPFTFGFSVYASFESDEVASTGRLPMPASDEELLGGHAVAAVGYDDGEKVLIVRNSWADDWGDGGYFYMPYDYAANRDLSDDFWTIRQQGR